MVLDPNDDDDVTGLVQIRGDLQVDGTTTTVNSVTTTIQDPIITLGGEDTLTLDDNKDRGIEFRYYDSQEDLVSLVGMKITQTATYGRHWRVSLPVQCHQHE